MSSSSSEASLSAKRLEGKVAIITGGASGVGEATARLFVKHGANVIIADIQDEKGQSLCNDITSNNTDGTISYVHCDVRNDTEVEKLVDVAISKYGKLDIMFNNAGIADDRDSSSSSHRNENFRKVLDINVTGSFLGGKHAARVMIPNKTGVILFTASIASVIGGQAPHAYTTSKHAIIGLMKNWCIELGEHGIRVNAISPGSMFTPLLSTGMGIGKVDFEELVTETNVLKGMILEPRDVAHAALYLASDEARFVTGLNLVIDGGYSTTNPSLGTAWEKRLNQIENCHLIP